MALLDGKQIAADVRAEVREGVEAYAEAHGRRPRLVVLLVGDNPASASYVRGKAKAAFEAGIDSETLTFHSDLSEEDLLGHIERLNEDETVNGILVQLPLPDHIDARQVIRAISPAKDVDGFHPLNAGKLMIGEDTLLPCTPAGIVELIARTGMETQGKHAVVIGRSTIVGRPMLNLISARGLDCTATICHRYTADLAEHTRRADILIVAVGRPGLITADMVKPGAVVIDVGINRIDAPERKRGYRLVGDVDFEGVKETAGFLTPVPGGVGPMTIAMLLKNTLTAAERQAETPALD